MGPRHWYVGTVSLDGRNNGKRFQLTDGQPRHHVGEARPLDGKSDADARAKPCRCPRHDRRRTFEMHELERNILALELVDDRQRRAAAGNAIGPRYAGGNHLFRKLLEIAHGALNRSTTFSAARRQTSRTASGLYPPQ